MSKLLEPRKGAAVLIDQLRIHGVETIFGVPGESYLAVLNSLRDANSIRYVACRHEGGASVMAEAMGKLSGAPGICFVTRGPGATNASIGVHTAMQDSTPMILFIGQINRRYRDREAFQEVDYRRMFGGLAKWVVEIDEAARIPELISQAFHRAVNGRPGPVVVALPKDMLEETVIVADAERYQSTRPHPGPKDIERFHTMLAAAQRPLVIAGGAGWTAEASRALAEWAESNALPVACAFRRQDALDNAHPCYVGDVGVGTNPSLVARIRDSDLIVAIGPRLGDITTAGYTLFDVPRLRQQLVHVHCDPEELGKVYQANLPILSGMAEFLSTVAALSPLLRPRWASRTAQARRDYLAHSSPLEARSSLDLAKVIEWLRGRLPETAIVTNGAGNYAGWVHRYSRYRSYGTQLAPTSGAMGYGVPAAIAAKLRHPERVVVAIAGDGCFLMSGQELATAMQLEAAVIIIVVNNGMYGTIRMHQEREYPEREYGTSLVNPDFAVFAKSFGAFGERVDHMLDFPQAFERALAANRPALIELIVDSNILTPQLTISSVRESSMSRQ